MAALRRRLLFQLVTSQRLEQQVRRSPTLQRRAYAAARRYVAGETIQDMLQVVAGLRGQDWRSAESTGADLHEGLVSAVGGHRFVRTTPSDYKRHFTCSR